MFKKIAFRPAAVLLATFLSGCASNMEWHHPSASSNQFYSDRAYCNSISGASRHTPIQSYDSSNPSFSSGFEQGYNMAGAYQANQSRQQMFNDCMMGKGYRLQPKSSSEVEAVSVSPSANKNSEDIKKDHYAKIAEYHPDWADIAGSDSLKEFITLSESEEYKRIQREGTATEVISLLWSYKVWRNLDTKMNLPEGQKKVIAVSLDARDRAAFDSQYFGNVKKSYMSQSKDQLERSIVQARLTEISNYGRKITHNSPGVDLVYSETTLYGMMSLGLGAQKSGCNEADLSPIPREYYELYDAHDWSMEFFLKVPEDIHRYRECSRVRGAHKCKLNRDPDAQARTLKPLEIPLPKGERNMM